MPVRHAGCCLQRLESWWLLGTLRCLEQLRISPSPRAFAIAQGAAQAVPVLPGMNAHSRRRCLGLPPAFASPYIVRVCLLVGPPRPCAGQVPRKLGASCLLTWAAAMSLLDRNVGLDPARRCCRMLRTGDWHTVHLSHVCCAPSACVRCLSERHVAAHCRLLWHTSRLIESCARFWLHVLYTRCDIMYHTCVST